MGSAADCTPAPRKELSLPLAVFHAARFLKHEPTNRRLLLWSIVGALVAWGALLGLGAYLGLDPQTPDRDYRRLLVVVAMTGGFLAFWLLMLALRRRR